MTTPHDEVREGLVKMRLVPVGVFGTNGCGDPDCEHCKKNSGYGLMDAVSSWSDCNRAERLIRVEEMLIKLTEEK